MPPKTIPQEKIDKVLELHSQGKTQEYIEKTVGISHGSVSRIVRGAYNPHQNKSFGEEAVFEEKQNTQSEEITDSDWKILIPKTDICTLDQLVEHCKIDLRVWQVEKFVCNKWAIGAKDKEGNIHVKPLFQVKAWLKKKRTIIDAMAEIELLKKEAKAEMRFPKPVIYKKNNSGNMLELLIPDLHAGKLAYGKETGHQNYDTKIAIETYRRAIDGIIAHISSYQVEKIILGVGNDLLQTDNIQGTTTAGTKVDTDSRFHKVYITVRKMLVEIIEKLRLIAPVDVKVVPGNHDSLAAFSLGDSLECYFHKYPDVLVDNEPIPHKIVEWGKCLLALTHGHKGKQADYGIWMATEYPEAFGRTKFREIHIGHKHKTSLDEKYGVRVRTLSALSGEDFWHSENHFVGNLRVAEGLIFNKDNGLIAQFFHTEH